MAAVLIWRRRARSASGVRAMVGGSVGAVLSAVFFHPIGAGCNRIAPDPPANAARRGIGLTGPA